MATLERVAAELEREVRVTGAVVNGKPHPALGELRRYTVEISRMSAPVAEEAEAEGVEALRLV